MCECVFQKWYFLDVSKENVSAKNVTQRIFEILKED